MKDYKKVADFMQSMPADREVLTKEKFLNKMKGRNLKYKQTIDNINGQDREVWGNSNFEIIVLHKSDNFQIL